MLRGYQFQLYPTLEQADKLRQFAGVCRLIYNLGLECRETFWREHKRNTGKHISYFTQSAELTQLRKEVDWIAEVPRCAQEAALKDLDNAYQRYFAGLGKYPRRRQKFVDDSFTVRGNEARSRVINARWGEVHIARLGWIKYRRTRDCGKIRTITASCIAGRWLVSIMSDVEVDQTPAPNVAVGIDRGVTNTLALSDGEMLSIPTGIAAMERRQRAARRSLSRKCRGSARHSKQRRRVAALSARMTRMRKDWHHRVTTDLARRFNCVVIEGLKVTNMTASGAGKRGLNRAILNQGWGIFGTLLEYKLDQRGGKLIKVPAAYTSQTCSACGTIDKGSRESQASSRCRHCGFAIHADHNAALNILRLGNTQSLRVEEAEYGSDEARTRGGLPVENHLEMTK